MQNGQILTILADVMNYIDRTNIGNAKIAGMDKDLKLDDSRKYPR